MSYYTVTLLDGEGHTIASCMDVEGLRNAKDMARSYLSDDEYLDDAERVATVTNDAGVIVFDARIRNGKAAAPMTRAQWLIAADAFLFSTYHIRLNDCTADGDAPEDWQASAPEAYAEAIARKYALKTAFEVSP